MSIERLSVELSQLCSKACWFCYSKSTAAGSRVWQAEDLIALVKDCKRHGLRSVSFGGGEPLEEPMLWPVLEQLEGIVPRALTSNGLEIERSEVFDRLVQVRPEKLHLSIHFPGNEAEVGRIIRQLSRLSAAGLRTGVNLLVQQSRLAEAKGAAQQLQAAGIDNQRIVYLPMRGTDTPTPDELAQVAGGRFQSMTCLSTCGKSPRFASLGWDKTVAWCSYTSARRPLSEPTFAGMMAALNGLSVEFCGNAPPKSPVSPGRINRSLAVLGR